MTKLGNEEKKAAILSYIHILVLIPLFTAKHKNDFIKFHVRQGLLLFFLELLVFFFVTYTKAFFWPLGFLLGNIANVGFTLVSLFAIWKAFNGDKWNIPILSDYVDYVNVK